jgi:hypothetical protein
VATQPSSTATTILARQTFVARLGSRHLTERVRTPIQPFPDLCLHLFQACFEPRINMYMEDKSGKRRKHVVGLAPVSGMCNSLNSCTISEGTSFQSVLGKHN